MCRRKNPLLTQPSPSIGEGAEGSSILGASFNFTNSIIGAGIVGLPSALNAAGFISGIALCVLVSVLTDITMKVGLAHGVESYEDLCSLAFGKKGYYVLLFFQFTFAYGAMCAYLLIVKEATTNVLLSWTDLETTAPALVDPRFLVSAFALIFILPICFYRDFSRLAKFSAVSLASVLFMVVAVVYGYAKVDPVPTSLSYDERYIDIHSNFVPALGTISFAFVCHHQTFLVFRSLKHQTMANFKAVTRLSVIFALVTSMVMAIFGYVAFFEHTKGNIFDSFVASSLSSSIVINLARFLLAVTMVLTYPMELVVCRYTIEVFLDSLRDASGPGTPGSPTGDVELLPTVAAAPPPTLSQAKSGPLLKVALPKAIPERRNLETAAFFDSPSPSPESRFSAALTPYRRTASDVGSRFGSQSQVEGEQFEFIEDSETGSLDLPSPAAASEGASSEVKPDRPEPSSRDTKAKTWAALQSDAGSVESAKLPRQKISRADSRLLYRMEDDLYLADPEAESMESRGPQTWDALSRQDSEQIRRGEESYGTIDGLPMFDPWLGDHRNLRVRSALLPKRKRMLHHEHAPVSGILRASGVLPLPESSYNKCRHGVLTLLLWATTLGIAVAVENLDTVLEITGSFSAVFLAFILPAAARIKLGLKPTIRPKYCSKKNLPVWALLVFGGIAFASGTGLSVVMPFNSTLCAYIEDGLSHFMWVQWNVN